MAVPVPGVRPTPRELETLRLVALGMTNEQIARRMGISRSTASCYVENLKVRLEATTRPNLVHRAHLWGLLGGSADGFDAGWSAALAAVGQSLSVLSVRCCVQKDEQDAL